METDDHVNVTVQKETAIHLSPAEKEQAGYYVSYFKKNLEKKDDQRKGSIISNVEQRKSSTKSDISELGGTGKISVNIMEPGILNRLNEIYSRHLDPDQKELTLKDFKKIVPAKNMFFVNRIFDIFDTDGDGKVSLMEFLKTVQSFSANDDDTKIEFLFKVFDTDGDGFLQEYDLRKVVEACLPESNLKLDEEDVTKLINVFFLDGRQGDADHVTMEDFKNQLRRHDDLVSNFSSMITGWLIPPEALDKRNKVEKMLARKAPSESLGGFAANSKTLCINIIIVVNLMIIAERLFYFRHFTMADGVTMNPMYQISRACGKALLINSVLVLLLVMRKSITALSRYGFAKVLPLDINIYLHKLVGIFIFVQGLIHSIMHFINFYINIQPNPVKFLQLTYSYWEALYGAENWTGGYTLPDGCKLVNSSSPLVDLCLPGSLDVSEDVDIDRIYNKGDFLCQACNSTGEPWTYCEWMFTGYPGVFGLVGGAANLTGILLMLIMAIIFFFSLPFIRRTGHFELFYYTHLLYWGYFVLMLFHAPQYCIVAGFFLFVWLGEQLFRILAYLQGKNKTTVTAGILLPSKVIGLVIERPAYFSFRAGDYVFIKIPQIASSEWHPFTISSAPEVTGYITLHIRSVGEWTTKLRDFFQAEQDRQQKILDYDNKGFEDNSAKNTPKMFTKDEKNGRVDGSSPNALGDDSIKVLNNSTVNTPIQKWLKTSKMANVDGGSIVNFDRNEIPENVKNEMANLHKNTKLMKPLQIYIDGPFGSPSVNFHRAEHAVFIGTGIGITPFASILQSIMHQYREVKYTCPNCEHTWVDVNVPHKISKMKKVDFFWINRDQKSFEWFISLLTQLEIEQAEHEDPENRFLDMHMYFTQALKRTDMKAIALHLALDMLYEKEKKDLVTGLKSRTHTGRPDWDNVFESIKDQKKGKVTVFYCGNPGLAKTLKYKCEEYGFMFSKEVF